jgi:AcrR family transcriptional regulator
MPKIVDHDQRRAELAQLVISVISREGLARTTARGIAREGGFTTGVLSHYFTDKEELVNFAFKAVAERIYERIDRRLKRATSVQAKLAVVLEELLPLKAGDEESVVSIIFWASAVHDHALRQQFAHQYDQWRTYLHEILTEGVKAGEIRPVGSVADMADLLIAVTDGLLVSWILRPERASRAARRRLVDLTLQVVGLRLSEAV